MGVILTFSLVLSMTLFQFIQLLNELRTASSTYSVMNNVAWFSSLPLILITQLNSVLSRRKILSFFQDWKKLETKLNRSCYSDLTSRGVLRNKLYFFMYFAYTVITLFSILSLTGETINNQETSVFLSGNLIVRENVPFPLIICIQLVTLVLVWILTSLIEIVPAFVYFHFSHFVVLFEEDALKAFNQFQASNNRLNYQIFSVVRMDRSDSRQAMPRSNNSERNLGVTFQLIWTRLENLNAFVHRANYLFGSILVAGQGISLFTMTVTLYSILYNLNTSLKDPVNFVTSTVYLLAVSFRYISCSLISSQLYQAINKFRNFLTERVGQNWGSIGKDDQKLLCSLIERLQSEPISACPLGLYNIHPSTLLTIFSLVVSYVIVLLQSK